MNAISLYVSTSRLVLQNDGTDKNLTDLYRLLPYLRQSLSCKSCGNLLMVPYSPSTTKCQHHVCKICIDERRSLKSQCAWCFDKQNFVENRQMRILLQCYKSLCEHIIMTPLYQEIRNTSRSEQLATTTSIADLIDEGAKFEDDFSSTGGLTKSAYSILPFVYNNSNTVVNTQPVAQRAPITTQATTQIVSSNFTQQQKIKENDPGPIIQVQQPQQQIHHVTVQKPPPQSNQISSCSSSVYSVLYAGSGNKITIKRKLDGNNSMLPTTTLPATIIQSTAPPVVSFKKPTPTVTPINQHIQVQQHQQQTQHLIKIQKPVITTTAVSTGATNVPVLTLPASPTVANKRKGCRCGNATLTPGKLTCCGQRCPCYVESKSCIDCKCRGCRNPHHPNGFKVRPHIAVPQVQLQQQQQQQQHLQTTTTSIMKPLVQIQSSPIQLSHHTTPTTYTPTTYTPVTASTAQIYTINDQMLNPIQITNSDSASSRQCVQFAQFINGGSVGGLSGGHHHHHLSPAAVTSTTNFSHLLNNTIIFNPADIPTIIDGGSIQTAEISIDL